MKRTFFFIALLFAAAACASATSEKTPRKEIAIQLYSVRSLIGSYGENRQDCSEVLKALAEMGYTGIEAASYADGRFYGKDPETFRKDVEGVGMRVLSSHCSKGLSPEELASGDFSESLKWWDACIAAHKAAGMSYIVYPYMEVPATLHDLQTQCAYLNAIGAKCREQGIRFGYHNHLHEFRKVEDQAVMLEYMLEHTDPENVFFQLDVYWAVMGQASPVDLFRKYPGRFRMLHIKDRREIGQSGMVGFDAIFRNAELAGVEQIVVEQEESEYDIEKGVEMSLDYLLEAPFVKASYEK
ncbi:sugar phosphate isomerase/epimerase [uncultured Alistipes sp.]|uniref:sugar phosphate isomerase/epimerase family protein n=1 Tax=uncultured Alistipes sp. TaxID=538949 RepID=UPI0026651EAF|nr:sugar phosphate isomerase/epimerase [uncultured Alistipes sp.]